MDGKGTMIVEEEPIEQQTNRFTILKPIRRSNTDNRQN